MLLASAAQAQFNDVSWSTNPNDSLLPVCSSIVALPADYAGYGYSVRVEYPEYSRMSAEEIARYALKSRYPSIAGEPLVESYVAVQAKQPQLSVALQPVVLRGGEY